MSIDFKYAYVRLLIDIVGYCFISLELELELMIFPLMVHKLNDQEFDINLNGDYLCFY